MLKLTRRGTYTDNTGFPWVFYGDTDKLNYFYVVPQPSYVTDTAGNPTIKLVTYKTDDPKTNGNGFLQLEVMLSVPPALDPDLKAAIAKEFTDAGAASGIQLQPLNYRPKGHAILTVPTDTGTSEFVSPASEFGANTATFTLQLTAKVMKTVEAVLAKKGGGLDVKYVASVPSSLPAVTATLHFNSALAYKYQVTHAQHHAYSHDTPRSVQKLLKQSASSSVKIEWGPDEPHPPADLAGRVSTWANETLQTEITEKVNAALAVLKESSYDSFSINAVSTFTSVYSENQVVDWFIYPEATLPSLTDLGKDIKTFSTTVNNRQQVMQIDAHLPFEADCSAKPNVPKTDKPLLLKQVVVTVAYPGLPQAESTFTFTKNGSHTFVAPYDTAHGSSYTVKYVATFKDDPAALTSKTITVNQGQYSLVMESVGILTVVFDAHQAFAAAAGTTAASAGTTADAVAADEVDISFSYVNSEGLGEPVTRTLEIKKTDKSHRKSVTSYTAQPLNAAYNYQVSYRIGTSTFKAPPQRGKNGPLQLVPAVAGLAQTNIILAYKLESSAPPILGVDALVWYDPATKVPVKNQPTKDNKTPFHLEPSLLASTSYNYDQKTFLGLRNGDQPLMYSGTINSLGGQTAIDDQPVENDQPSIIISPTQRYFTLRIDPVAIDWKTATFISVQVIVTGGKTTGGPKGGPQQSDSKRTIIFNKGDNLPAFVSYPFNEGQSLSYDWSINYITKGSPVQTVKGKKTSVTAFGSAVIDVKATPGK